MFCCRFQLLACKALFDSEDWDQDEVVQAVEEDLEREIGDHPTMHPNEFLNSLFEMVDVWTESINTEEYFKFLRNLFLRITKVVGAGKFRRYKKLEEVVAFDKADNVYDQESKSELFGDTHEHKITVHSSAEGHDLPSLENAALETPTEVHKGSSFRSAGVVGLLLVSKIKRKKRKMKAVAVMATAATAIAEAPRAPPPKPKLEPHNPEPSPKPKLVEKPPPVEKPPVEKPVRPRPEPNKAVVKHDPKVDIAKAMAMKKNLDRFKKPEPEPYYEPYREPYQEPVRENRGGVWKAGGLVKQALSAREQWAPDPFHDEPTPAKSGGGGFGRAARFSAVVAHSHRAAQHGLSDRHLADSTRGSDRHLVDSNRGDSPETSKKKGDIRAMAHLAGAAGRARKGRDGEHGEHGEQAHGESADSAGKLHRHGSHRRGRADGDPAHDDHDDAEIEIANERIRRSVVASVKATLAPARDYIESNTKVVLKPRDPNKKVTPPRTSDCHTNPWLAHCDDSSFYGFHASSGGHAGGSAQQMDDAIHAMAYASKHGHPQDRARQVQYATAFAGRSGHHAAAHSQGSPNTAAYHHSQTPQTPRPALALPVAQFETPGGPEAVADTAAHAHAQSAGHPPAAHVHPIRPGPYYIGNAMKQAAHANAFGRPAEEKFHLDFNPAPHLSQPVSQKALQRVYGGSHSTPTTPRQQAATSHGQHASPRHAETTPYGAPAAAEHRAWSPPRAFSPPKAYSPPRTDSSQERLLSEARSGGEHVAWKSPRQPQQLDMRQHAEQMARSPRQQQPAANWSPPRQQQVVEHTRWSPRQPPDANQSPTWNPRQQNPVQEMEQAHWGPRQVPPPIQTINVQPAHRHDDGQQSISPGQRPASPMFGQQTVSPGQQSTPPGQQSVSLGQQSVSPGQQSVSSIHALHRPQYQASHMMSHSPRVQQQAPQMGLARSYDEAQANHAVSREPQSPEFENDPATNEVRRPDASLPMGHALFGVSKKRDPSRAPRRPVGYMRGLRSKGQGRFHLSPEQIPARPAPRTLLRAA